jgi:hypothetical protein
MNMDKIVGRPLRMNENTLDAILGESTSRGGVLMPSHKDLLPSIGYIANFDPNELGRHSLSKGIINVSYDRDHVDVIENLGGQLFHIRIYKPEYMMR